MPFEYSCLENDKNFKINSLNEKEIVNDITSKFKSWDNARAHQVRAYKKIKPEIYIKDRESNKPAWKSDKKTNKLYSLFQTRQAYIWENIYSNLDKMFDVEGQDANSATSAKYQKMALIDAFNNMKIASELDKAIELLDSVGEMCLFCCWKKKTKPVRRKKSNFGSLKLVKDELLYGVFEKEIYNGAYIEAINPLNLVFSAGIRPECDEEWAKSGKIIKSFLSVSEIEQNKAYNLSKEALQFLKSLTSKSEDAPANDIENIDEIISKDGKIEVLEYWGDYNFSGSLLSNFSIAIVARKYLARFSYNPFIINPIINVATGRDPDSGRGISCLYSVYDLVKSQEDDINEMKDVQQLNKNPARFAPENFFNSDEVDIEPGKIIKYKQGLDDPSAIISVSVPLIDASNQINYLDKIISEVSGIYPNMQGMNEMLGQTATEVKVKVEGQTTRLAKDLDTIKQNGIIKMVENVAEMMANENLGEAKEIFVPKTGEKIIISDETRLGSYNYRYSDSTSLISRKNKFNEAFNLFQIASKDEELNQILNKKNILITGLEMIGMDNTDRFFLSDEEQKMKVLQEQVMKAKKQAQAVPNPMANMLPNMMPNAGVTGA